MNRYRFRYYWSTDEKALHSQAKETFKEWYKDIDSSTTVSAITQFHNFLQGSREIAYDRKTLLRPMLKPSQYVVISLHQIYHDAAFHKNPSHQPLIESQIDYPRSPNPRTKYDYRGGLDPFATTCKSYAEFDFGTNQSDNQ